MEHKYIIVVYAGIIEGVESGKHGMVGNATADKAQIFLRSAGGKCALNRWPNVGKRISWAIVAVCDNAIQTSGIEMAVDDGLPEMGKQFVFRCQELPLRSNAGNKPRGEATSA